MYTFKEHPRRKRETEKKMDGREREKGTGKHSGHAGCRVHCKRESARDLPIAFSFFLLLLVSFASSSSLASQSKSFGLSFIRRLCRLATTVSTAPFSTRPPSSLFLLSLFSRVATRHISRGFSSLKLRKRRQIGNHMLRFFSSRKRARSPPGVKSNGIFYFPELRVGGGFLMRIRQELSMRRVHLSESAFFYRHIVVDRHCSSINEYFRVLFASYCVYAPFFSPSTLYRERETRLRFI